MTDPTATSGPPPRSASLHSFALAALKWIAIGIGLLGTAALSGYLSMRQAVRGGEVAVPALQGASLEEASTALRKAGLFLEKTGERSDERFEEGRILMQDPPAGAKLKRNRKVRVVLSLGMQAIQAPLLVGQPARRAQISLQQAGLKIGEIAYVHSARTAGDRILAQEPPSGTRMSRDGSVDLLVSKGPPTKAWVMPLVEGQEIGRVTRIFSDAGFRVGNVRREPAPGIAPGIVVRQYPLSGYPLAEGDSISLVVSAEGGDNG